jgi:protein ImuB
VDEPLRFEEEFEPETPVELLEPLSFLLARLLNDLIGRITARALATNEIHLTFTLENANPHRCTLRLPVPFADAGALLKLLQLELNARPPCAPVTKLRMELCPVTPRVEQHGLFIAQAPEPTKLEITLARLSNLLGVENVGTPELVETHRPDAFRMARFSAVAYEQGGSCPVEVLTLRRYRPPQIAQVSLVRGTPVYIATSAIKSKIAACAGPWRSSGDWWKRDPWDRAEWDIATTGNGLYRIYEDLLTGRWFLEGNYD